MKLFWQSASILAVILTPQIALGEMVIHSKNGQRYTVPIDARDLKKIEFSSANSIGSNWQGLWNTSEGKMNLSQIGNNVTGVYNQDNGKIQGTVADNVLNGYWIESSSARKCSTPKLNSFHWGRISWQLSSNQQNFTGKWSYCDDAPDAGWTGNR